MNESTCAGCGRTDSDKLFDFKQLTSISSPLLCRTCLSASVHKPPRERVGFLDELWRMKRATSPPTSSASDS